MHRRSFWNSQSRDPGFDLQMHTQTMKRLRQTKYNNGFDTAILLLYPCDDIFTSYEPQTLPDALVNTTSNFFCLPLPHYPPCWIL